MMGPSCYHPTVTGRSGVTSLTTLTHRKEGQELTEQSSECFAWLAKLHIREEIKYDPLCSFLHIHSTNGCVFKQFFQAGSMGPSIESTHFPRPNWPTTGYWANSFSRHVLKSSPRIPFQRDGR